MLSLRIATWNVNGLSSHTQELEVLLKANKVDIALISKTHLNDHKKVKIDNYSIYNTNHPDCTAHGGSAVIIKNNIKHHLHSEFREEWMQSTTVTIDGYLGPINVSAIYCPPRHQPKQDMFNDYFSSLGNRFISGGDWNCKNTHWGSRLTTTKGRELKKCVDQNNLVTLGTGEPTYWPTDVNRIPDLVDFFVIKGLSDVYFNVESLLDSVSDHTPIVATFSISPMQRVQKPSLYNNKTDWNAFTEFLDDEVKLKVKLKTEEDIDEATFYITNLIQVAAWRSTPALKCNTERNNIPLEIRDKLQEKRTQRRQLHMTRSDMDRSLYNKISRELRELIDENKNAIFQHKISSLSAHKKDNYSLWKMTKNFKRPQNHIPPLRKTSSHPWARSDREKAELFANHLSEAFTPNVSTMEDFEKEVDNIIQSDQQLSAPIKLVTPKEVARTIQHLQNKKAPGFDLITAEVLKRLPKKVIVFLTMLFNSIFRIQYYPKLWKISQICMIPKPGKPPTDPTSYRPISLLPILSKVFEKTLLRRLKPILDESKIIPDHQFGFRENHATVEQVHRVVHVIRQSLEKKEYCSAAFIDIQQAFDRVWHKGLLYKMKTLLPNSFFMILKSYLHQRKFQVKYGEEYSNLYLITASVPQGSVLGPVLYSIYTADLPETEGVVTATYADDTACLASDKDPNNASSKLQAQLDKIDSWLRKWRIKASVTKSTQITFTLRRGDCPPVRMDNKALPNHDSVKYLGLHLDRRLTWSNHIKAKRTEANLQFQSLNWLLGRQSPLCLSNKLLVYKTIIKPIWTYGIELWGSASNSNIEILQRFQNIALRTISSAHWFVRNTEIHEYLEMPTVREEVSNVSKRYKERLSKHTNELAKNLLQSQGNIKRLKRWHILDLEQRT
ncbi:hypothetical protein PYW07_006892 [Mythimna separata]|uniref:Reverse transcriptase domain-containing protein n=1 Tax=Mythimna separata TaxID=271217 RepID=A0AAD7Z0X8_MYTSE|nr:hypothetical protein PYW07_006892 [Mythimna separata]